jgi:glycerol-1-phosphate dehydrogenase [NAD(P)+]
MRNLLDELLPGNDSVKTNIVIELTLAGAAFALLSRIGFTEKRMLVVCDANTREALAGRLMNELSALEPQLLTLNGKVQADEAAIAKVRSQKAQAIVAVGGGTISDICKYASAADGIPFAVFPTAPSMNGYLSANASVTLQGVKESHKAQLPMAVFCDLGVIAAAPIRLIRSGLGDSLCRPTAQADWLLSHLLLDTPYTAKPFNLLKPYEAELFAHADKLAARDIRIIGLLLKTLLVSGLGMTIAGGSMPASQGEHMIAHTMEMKHGDDLPGSFHGEEIGVTTLTMAKMQEEQLSRPLHLPPRPRWEDALTGYFGSERGKRIATASAKKYELYERYDAIVSALKARESEIRDALREVTLPQAFLHDVLRKAGAPTTPKDLGWNEADYFIAVSRARFTRDRFTFLDLL